MMLRTSRAVVPFLVILYSSVYAVGGTIDFTSGVPVFPEPADFTKSDDGVTFSFSPVDNLVGSPRFISSANGLRFGGGGGSSLEFQFNVDAPVTLDTYSLASFGLLGNPDFNVLDGVTSVSGPNAADMAGLNDFAGMPTLEADKVYTFKVNTSGAAVQSNFESWGFSVVPEPNGFVLALMSMTILLGLRRKLP